MYLKRFQIWKLGELIRNVDFRNGLNLIVDDTSTRRTDSGNNVGKTTFLRCIDYCLGADGESLYQDPEFKDQVNESVLQFLNTGARFKLEVVNVSGHTSTIERIWQASNIINGQEFTSLAAFRAELGRILFGLRETKPSFREAIGKFLRIEERELTNVIYYLHSATQKASYDALYLFLFGFPDQNLLVRRHTIVGELRKLKRQRLALKTRSQTTIQQLLAVIDRDISELETQIGEYAVGPEHKSRIAHLSEIRSEISTKALLKSQIDMEINAARETAADLRASRVSIDLDTLRTLYEETTLLHPDVSRTFEDLVEFHNAMVENKASYVLGTLQASELKTRALAAELEVLLSQEKDLLSGLASEGALDDLMEIQKHLDRLYEERGRRRALLEELQKVESEEAEATQRLIEIGKVIEVHVTDLQGKIEEFNLIFSRLCRSLYGEEYVFTLDVIDSGAQMVSMELVSVEGNEGTGKKRAKTVAFDLAYTEWAMACQIRRPYFVAHDQVEVVDGNQLATLLEVGDSSDGQFIVAVLSDRLDSLELNWLDNATILRLSQDDRFFRIESGRRDGLAELDGA